MLGRDVHPHGTAVELLTIEILDGTRGRFSIGHGHEAEASGLPSASIRHDRRVEDFATCGEEPSQIFCVRLPAQAADEQSAWRARASRGALVGNGSVERRHGRPHRHGLNVFDRGDGNAASRVFSVAAQSFGLIPLFAGLFGFTLSFAYGVATGAQASPPPLAAASVPTRRTATPSIASASASTSLAVFCSVDANSTAVELRAIERRHRCLGMSRITEGDESETTGATRVAVRDDFCVCNSTKALERTQQ